MPQGEVSAVQHRLLLPVEYRVYSEQASKLDCTRTRREPSMAAALTKCIRTVARTRASCEGLKLLVCHSWYWRRGIILTEVDSNEPEFAFTNLFTGSPEFGSLSLLLPCLKRRCPRVGEERTKPGRRSSCPNLLDAVSMSQGVHSRMTYAGPRSITNAVAVYL
jgi:hypothetical protein